MVPPATPYDKTIPPSSITISPFCTQHNPPLVHLISHAGFLKEHKRAQYLLLAEGRENELAALDAESIAERMQLGLGLRVHE